MSGAPRLSLPLPACRVDAAGGRHVDLRAILALALPLVLNSGIQAVLNITDTWFVGRISPTAVAGLGAVYWFVLGIIFVLGGIGMVVQSYAAQAEGGRRYRRASRAAWSGLWASIVVVPVFVLLAFAGASVVGVLGLAPSVATESVAYWGPRIGGGALAVALMGLQGFLNGVGQVRLTVAVNVLVALVNAGLNEVFIFSWGLGVAGSAWATNAAMAMGVLLCLALLWWHPRLRSRYDTRRTWRPQLRALLGMIRVGLPIGVAIAFDLLGMALFQVMMVRVGVVEGAATQIVAMLTSIAYMPGVGLGMAGTTLVGQSIGAGDRAWAFRVGNRVIFLAMGWMGAVGLVLALCGPWLMHALVGAADSPDALATRAIGAGLLWVAAAYQLFDGLHLASSFCLRGAGDTRFPAVALMCLSWTVFIPLSHVLIFAPGQGYVDWLPALGWGAAGGWWAATVYMVLLGLTLGARWGARVWMRLGALR